MANLLPSKVKNLADQSMACLDVVFNFVITEHSLLPPLKLPQRNYNYNQQVQTTTHERVACLNMAANAFGEMPLLHSHVRLDPVLYQDHVSMSRKEYKQMDS